MIVDPDKMMRVAAGLLCGILVGMYLLRKYSPWRAHNVMTNITIVALAISVVLLIIKIVVYAVTGEKLPF